MTRSAKRPLPLLPRRVAVVTSPTGAALFDFLKIIHRRHPGLNILIAPVRVQGREAPAMIAAALADLNRLAEPPEVIVVARGGGSLEDLWAFNTEEVARAVAASKIPLISAVGHEVDFTIADFVADLRAPTPSAAAELLIRPRREWLELIAGLRTRLARAAREDLSRRGLGVAGLARRLKDPARMIERRLLRTADLTDRLDRAWRGHLAGLERRRGALSGRLAALWPGQRLARARERLGSLGKDLEWRMAGVLKDAAERSERLFSMLNSLSPLNILARGYSLTRLPEGRVLTDAREVGPGDKVEVLLARGELSCLVSCASPDRCLGGEGPKPGRKRS